MTYKLFNQLAPTWVYCVLLTFILYVFFFLSQKFIVNRGRKRAAKTTTQLDDLIVEVISKIRKYFLFAVSIYLGVVWVELPERWRVILEKTFILIMLIQVAQLASLIINFWVTKYLRAKSEENFEMASTIGLISFGAKVVTYTLIFLFALNNLGVDITALIAGLGVGGIAIALAMQNILTDLFSSLTIVLDKPFIIGDFIVVNDLMGTVEHIGLKTTRVRSLSGEQLIFGNGDLLQSRIKNYKRMFERRVVQKLTVTYQTKSKLLNEIPKLVKEIVERQNKVRFDRCHFLNFADSALEYELVYWVVSSDFNEYADRAHAINIEIFEIFNQHKIDFAYPTQTLHLHAEKSC